MIAKGFALAKDFYRYNARMLRDHEISVTGYPWRVCVSGGLKLSRTSPPIRSRRRTAGMPMKSVAHKMEDRRGNGEAISQPVR